MVQKSTPEEILLRQRSAVSVLSLDDAKLYDEASESQEDDDDSSDVQSDEEDERLQGVQEQDNAADEVDVREDNLEGDGDVDGNVNGKADDDTGGHQGAQYAYSDYDDDATEAVPLQKVVSVYEVKHRVPTNPNLGSASEAAPEKEVEVQSLMGKGEDGNELDSAPKENAEVQSATQKEEGRDDDVVEESNQPFVNETDVDASPDLGTISGEFPPTSPPPSFRSVNDEECDDESVGESVEVMLDDQGHQDASNKTEGSSGILKIVRTTTTTLIQRTIGLQKRRSTAKPDLPKAPQQLARYQSSPSGAFSTIMKPKSVLRSKSAGISKPKKPTPNVPVGKSVHSRGVIPALPRGISSETEKSNESKKPEKKERMTAAPDAQSKGSSPDDEFGNMVDLPLLLRKSRSAHAVVWQYPLKTYLGQDQGPKASQDLVLDNSETKASTIQKKLTSENESSNAMKPDPAPTKKTREKESVVNQSKDIIIRNIDSRSSSGTSGLSNSTSATEVTEKAGNRTIRTFHPFGGVRSFFSSESEKERSVLKTRKINKKKSKRVYRMTQGLGKDNSEDSRIATMTTIEEKPAASNRRDSVRKHTSIQTSKERKSRFTFKMW